MIFFNLINSNSAFLIIKYIFNIFGSRILFKFFFILPSLIFLLFKSIKNSFFCDSFLFKSLEQPTLIIDGKDLILMFILINIIKKLIKLMK